MISVPFFESQKKTPASDGGGLKNPPHLNKHPR